MRKAFWIIQYQQEKEERQNHCNEERHCKRFQKVKPSGKRAKNGQLRQIIKSHKKKRYLEDVDVPEATIRMRIQQNHFIVHHNHYGGLQSPLLELDDTVVVISTYVQHTDDIIKCRNIISLILIFM